jgi:Ca-activated chloride channel family protein
MRSGILAALAGVRPDAQRQVVLITDGQIGFEAEVVRAICDKLPPASRLHTVGVGSGVNRSLTGPAARAGHGLEVILGLGEDPERAASRLVARTTAPLLVDLQLSGSALIEHAPEKLPDLFAASPALISVALKPEGGDIVVRGRTLEGSWEQTLRVDPLERGAGNPAVVALFGRERVEDLETRLAAGAFAHTIDPQIEQLGLHFQIATRLTSWVAVSKERTVDPGDPRRHQRMPHELPYGMSAEGLGLRAPASADGTAQMSLQGLSKLALAEPEDDDMPAIRAPMKLEARHAEKAEAKKEKVDLKARLARAEPKGIAAPPSISPGIPLPPFSARSQSSPSAAPEAKPSAQQQTIRVELSEDDLAMRRARRRTPWVLALVALFLILLAVFLAFYLR